MGDGEEAGAAVHGCRTESAASVSAKADGVKWLPRFQPLRTGPGRSTGVNGGRRMPESARAASERTATTAAPAGARGAEAQRGGGHPLAGLQRAAGNAAVRRLLAELPAPPRLAVTRPGDAGEREAERMADRVMRMGEPAAAADGAFGIRRMEVSLARSEVGADAGGAAAPPVVHQVLKRPGAPLDGETRRFMEPRLGTDLGGVRVHTDPLAARSARAVEAHAYTVGRQIVFGAGRYAPGTPAGRRLLAHELAHVLQQQSHGPRVQRQACPVRPAGEATASASAGGVLPADVELSAAVDQLAVQDFAVGSAALPAGVTATPQWERFMSMVAGDPGAATAVKGYTDCVGSAPENLQLRDDRAQALIAAMPAAARARPRFSWPTSPTTDFRDTNATAQGRARNRSVVVRYASGPTATGVAACDRLTRASNLDEYLFLVRCAETRLGVGATGVISALRQIYYGNAAWSISRNAVWNDVIPNRPWNPGTNPETVLGAGLSAALRASQVVQGTDIGHVLTGIDAMLNPREVELHMGPVTLPTGLWNEEWATWAGDVGSAAAEFTADSVGGTLRGNLAVYFNDLAGADDLAGDIDAFAMRAGLRPAAAPPALLRSTMTPGTPLSELLMQYYRITSSAQGSARANRKRSFIQAYGGVLSGTTLTNRPALEAALRPSVENFAGRFFAFTAIQRGFMGSNPPPGLSGATATLAQAVTDTTTLFVDYLLAP
jgi:outer membrane protein OmpA-like peptidoglycan-associated protein